MIPKAKPLHLQQGEMTKVPIFTDLTVVYRETDTNVSKVTLFPKQIQTHGVNNGSF